MDGLKDNNPKSYWKLLESLKHSNADSGCIDIEEWRGYFMDLSSRDPILDRRRKSIESKFNKCESVKCFGELNLRITKKKELLKGVKTLRNNKAVGLDGTSNETIKYSQHAMHDCLLKVFKGGDKSCLLTIKESQL